MKTIELTDAVGKDGAAVRGIIAGNGKKAQRSIYQVALDRLSEGTRNTQPQVQYLSAFENAVGVFRAAALELRKEMDVLSLEQRLAATQPEASQGDEALRQQISDAIFLSNRYALAVAGHTGLAAIGAEGPAAIESKFSFGAKMDTSKDRDALTGILASVAADDLARIVDAKKAGGQPIEDDALLHTLEAIFSSWTGQFKWATHKEVAERHGLQNLTLRYGTVSVKAGESKRRFDTVVVDEKVMRVTKEEIVGGEDLGTVLWSNLIKLGAYDNERKKNPHNPASVIFTYGAPGCGKTLTAHAYIQSFANVCRGKGIPLWAFTHSTTDYASHYQNKTANELSALAGKVRDFPGPVVMYVADADNIFQSRKDPRLTSEQQQTLSVYFKMFDGSFIPKNGKFLAVMDANYLEGIDDATKSRLFDEVIECKRFEKAEQFAELARRSITGGTEGVVIADDDWLTIGKYLLDGPLSNREISHVTSRLRRGFTVPEEMLGKPYDEHVRYRNEQLKGINKESVIKAIDDYVEKRLDVERKAQESLHSDDRDRFLSYLNTKNAGTQPQ